DSGTKITRVTAGRGTRDEARLAPRFGEAPIETHSAFCDDEWILGHDPFVERFIQRGAFIPNHAVTHIDAGATQRLDSATVVTRVGIDRADNDGSDSAFNDRLCARTGAPASRAWLERDVHCRS